jgi:hypothetical protein
MPETPTPTVSPQQTPTNAPQPHTETPHRDCTDCRESIPDCRCSPGEGG